MKNFIYLLLSILFLFNSASIFAQKYGKVYSKSLLAKTSEVQEFNTYMETEDLKLKNLVEEFTKDYSITVEKFQKGEYSQSQQINLEAELKKRQDNIVDQEKQLRLDLIKKQELLLPLAIANVKKAIKIVKQKNNLELVFDITDAPALLAPSNTIDITSLVEKELK